MRKDEIPGTVWDELKPCPFCGSTDVGYNDDYGFMFVTVECLTCGGQTGRVTTFERDGEKGYYDACDKAAKIWNTRVYQDEVDFSQWVSDCYLSDAEIAQKKIADLQGGKE